MALAAPPDFDALCRTEVACETQHGRFVIGPASKFQEIELATTYSHDAPSDPKRKDGMFYTRATSLVAEAEHYEPTGVLVWLPNLGMFGSWDDEHLDLYVFPDVSLEAILAAPAEFLTTQWEPSAQLVWEVVRLEDHFDFVPYRHEAIVLKAFAAGPTPRKAAIKRWRPLYAKYPGLTSALDSAIHHESVESWRLTNHGKLDAARKRLDRALGFFGALVPTEALAKLGEARERLAACTAYNRLAEIATVEHWQGFDELLRRAPLLQRQELDAVLAQLLNLTRALCIARQRDAARALVATYRAVKPELGPHSTQFTGAVSGKPMAHDEAIASHLVGLACVLRDAALFDEALALVPGRITDAVLAFNIACFHALTRQTDHLLAAVDHALCLGKTVEDFEKDTDFDGVREDPKLQAVFATHRKLTSR